jgi:general secretion pathway protein G
MNKYFKLVSLKFNSLIKKLPKSDTRGFSLLEIIIVIAIIGTLVGIIVNRLSGGTDNAKVGITDTKAYTLQSKLIQYQLSHDNKFPTTEQGLDSLTASTGGVPIATEDDLTDGWGNKFDYKLTSKGPLIISMGKDGQAGTSSSICYLSGKKLDACSSADSGAAN